MITGFNEIVSQLLNLFQWWVVIAPWEMAIRVRHGSKTSVLGPGIHFRIPALDRFFVQRINMRYMNTPTQTVTTLDGKAITISGATGYSIKDIGVLYNTLSDAQDVVEMETLALVAQYVAANRIEDVIPDKIAVYVNQHLNLDRYGLGDVCFKITDFAVVKTYRIINANPKDYSHGSTLNTQAERTVGKPSQ